MKYPPHQDARAESVHPKPPTSSQRRRPASGSKESEGDEVALSPSIDEVRRLTELTKSLPDVRQDKIEDIKRRIQAGTYEVSAESVVRSIADLHSKLSSDPG